MDQAAEGGGRRSLVNGPISVAAAFEGSAELALAAGLPRHSFAGIMLDYLGQRPNTMTATNLGTRWLLPGRRAGQPMTPDTLEIRLRNLGFPTQRGRTSAIRHLVLQAPAPVVARMLGYHDDTTAQLAAEAGGTRKRYAPGDHTR